MIQKVTIVLYNIIKNDTLNFALLEATTTSGRALTEGNRQASNIQAVEVQQVSYDRRLLCVFVESGLKVDSDSLNQRLIIENSNYSRKYQVLNLKGMMSEWPKELDC